MTTSGRTTMSHHPDLMELRDRYDQVAESPMAQLTHTLMMMAGLYVALSPWIVGFTEFQGLWMSCLVIGLMIAVLSVGFASAYGRTHGMSWACTMLGVWVFFSTWLIDGDVSTTETVTSNCIAGGVVVLLGLYAGYLGGFRPRGVWGRHHPEAHPAEPTR